MKGRVVMHRSDQVGVVRHLEQLQVARGIPACRPDYDDTIRVGLANDTQRAGREYVPGVAVETTVRFVVELEHQPGTARLEACSHLLPQYHEADVHGCSSNGKLAGIESVTIELPVVMHVDDDHQTLGQELVDHGFDTHHERRINRERGIGARVIAPAYRQPYRGEACSRCLVD